MNESRVLRDIVFARVDDKDLLLDLYLPEGAAGPLPLIVWVHGGGWQAGSKENARAARMTQRGYAVASISYRLSHEAIFPAQIHDCKAAVRWLRANAQRYNLDPNRFGAWGPSAGGHLVALLGTSGGVTELEGDEGNLSYSSRVQAVCDYFGPTDLLAMKEFPCRIDRDDPNCPEARLIGGGLAENPDKVRLADPITYVTPDDPPFLIVHGDQDDVVPFNQSDLLYQALKKAGVVVTFHTVEGAGHGFGEREPAELVNAFFDRHLKG